MLVYSVSTTVESKSEGQSMFRREPGQWFNATNIGFGGLNIGNRGHVKKIDANFEKLMSGTFGMAMLKYLILQILWYLWWPFDTVPFPGTHMAHEFHRPGRMPCLQNWLVVLTILKNMSSSMGRINIPYILEE